MVKLFLPKQNKVSESFTIKISDFDDFNYINLKYCDLMQEHFLSNSFLKLGDQVIEISSPRDLIRDGLDQSKNYSVQRYKGLGNIQINFGK